MEHIAELHVKNVTKAVTITRQANAVDVMWRIIIKVLTPTTNPVIIQWDAINVIRRIRDGVRQNFLFIMIFGYWKVHIWKRIVPNVIKAITQIPQINARVVILMIIKVQIILTIRTFHLVPIAQCAIRLIRDGVLHYLSNIMIIGCLMELIWN